MTDTRLHFYFNQNNTHEDGSYSICVDNGEENVTYIIYDIEQDTFPETIDNESNESAGYYKAVKIYSLDNVDLEGFEFALGAGRTNLQGIMSLIRLYPSLTLLGTLDWDGINGEVIEEFYIEKPELPNSTLVINNKTVSSLYIHNKEVQSIITTDNVVLYEKESTPILSEPNSISISTSKYILSEHDNDTCVLSATVTDEDNNACSNQTVTFKANNTVLGTATTDSNGVATYTYNSQGIGDVTITVECESLIETQTIEDCNVYYITSQISDFPSVSKGSDTFAVSNYSISLQNYSVEFKCSSGVQVTVGNQNDWVFACNIGMYNGSMSTHQSTGSVLTENGVFNSTNRVYRVEVEGTTIRVYNLNLLVKTYTNCKINYPTNLRAYPYTSRGNIQYIKVKPL